MRINDIEINGFQCYKKEKFSFGKDFTILIGNNGTGKTTVLKALKYALSVFFTNTSKWEYQSINKEVSDLGILNINQFEIHKEGSEPDESISLDVTASFNNVGTDWKYYKLAKPNARINSTLFKDAFYRFIEQFKKNNKLPIFSFYSEGFPHSETNLGSNVNELFKQNTYDWYPSWGYYHWGDYNSCTSIWQQRFININFDIINYEIELRSLTENSTAYNDSLSRLNKLKSENNFIINILKNFTSASHDESDDASSFQIENIGIKPKSKNKNKKDFSIYFKFADGIERTWEEFPAGFNRLISIVFDLAYRSFILNSGNTNIQPFGFVMIDEIDVHLHPSLQQTVVQRFKSTFPNIQFVATTHSPLVISNFKQDENNYIIQTYRNGDVYSHNVIKDVYGFNLDLILSDVMGTDLKDFMLELLKSRYLRFKKEQDKEYMNKTLLAIKANVSSHKFEKIKQDLENQ